MRGRQAPLVNICSTETLADAEMVQYTVHAVKLCFNRILWFLDESASSGRVAFGKFMRI